MAEYIEREAAIRHIKENKCSKCSDIGLCGNCAVLISIKLFEAIPAADVAPVVHGRWFLDGDYEYINCSVCQYPFYMGFETSADARKYLSRDDKWKYCPNCGAKMDKDGDGE